MSVENDSGRPGQLAPRPSKPAPVSTPPAPTKDGEPWRPTVSADGVTDVGKSRKHNEDNILVRSDLGLFVVADGMGGHNAGEVASDRATKSIGAFFEATCSGPIPGEPLEEDEGLSSDARRLAAAVRKANADIHEMSTTQAQHRGMGSTVVALFLPRATGLVHVAHVGDSRCYRHRAGVLEQITRDHSLINDALELKPDLTPAELARLPKNIITRALGMKREVLVDVRTEAVRPGDTFLLCSDGLSGPVKEPQIHEVMQMGGDVHEMAETLIAMANDGGGNDNISAIVVRAEAEDTELELVEVDDLLSTPAPPDSKVATSPVKPPPPLPKHRPAATGSLPKPAVPPAPAPSVPSARPARRSARAAALPTPAEPSPLASLSVRKPETSAALPVHVGAAGLLIPMDETPAELPIEVDTAHLMVPFSDTSAGLPIEVDAAGLLIPMSDPPADRPIELELEARDAPPAFDDPHTRYKVACCRVCNAELLVGNMFCVECGSRIE